MTLIVSATNRPNSKSLKIAKYYQKQLSLLGDVATILTLENLPTSLMDGNYYGKQNPDFTDIQNLISSSQKFIFIVPEYNGSFPGALKLLIDACKFPDSFYDKKVALIGHSTGKYGNIRGIDHLTGVCHYLNLQVMPLKLHIPNISNEFNEDGDFYKEDTLKFTKQQIENFVRF